MERIEKAVVAATIVTLPASELWPHHSGENSGDSQSQAHFKGKASRSMWAYRGSLSVQAMGKLSYY